MRFSHEKALADEIKNSLNIHSALDEDFQLVPRIDAGWSAVVKDSDRIRAVDSAVKGLKVTKVITVTTGASGSARPVLNMNSSRFSAFNNSSQPTPLSVGAMPVIPPSSVLFYHVDTLGDQMVFRDNTLFVKRQRTSAMSRSVPQRRLDCSALPADEPRTSPEIESA